MRGPPITRTVNFAGRLMSRSLPEIGAKMGAAFAIIALTEDFRC